MAGAALSLAANLASAQTGDDTRYQKLEDEVKALRQLVSTLQEQHTREIGELKAAIQAQAAAASKPGASTTPAPAAPLSL